MPPPSVTPKKSSVLSLRWFLIGDYSHIAPCVVLAGGVTVGHGTLIGLGSRLLPLVSVGSKAIVGAGSVVTRDVRDGETVVGAPAKALEASL